MRSFFDKKLLTDKNIIIGYFCGFGCSLFVLYFCLFGIFGDSEDNQELLLVESLQNIITQIHEDDSDLYNILLSREGFNSSDCSNEDKRIIVSDLLKLRGSEFFNSNKLATTIEDFYSINNVRDQIIVICEKDGVNFEKIGELMNVYEKNVEIVLAKIGGEIKTIVEYRMNYQRNILCGFFAFQVIWSVLFLFLYFRQKENSSMEGVIEKEILDSDSRKILEFISVETGKGVFPTFKDLKLHLKLSHPTVLSKVSILEKKNLIGIKKKGRNKHLFLK